MTSKRVDFDPALAAGVAAGLRKGEDFGTALDRVLTDPPPAEPEDVPDAQPPQADAALYVRWVLARVRAEARTVDFEALALWQVEDVLVLRGRRMEFDEWQAARFQE